MNKTVLIIGAVGVVAIGGYFVYNAVSQHNTECAGDWTDNINPACLLESAGNFAKSEVNTILIIISLVIVLVVALLAFGPGTEHIASATRSLAVL